jgi:hypothetical protein
MDADPQRIDAALVLIYSFRGFIGFGFSFKASNFVTKVGYERAFNICAGIVAALMDLGVVFYLLGGRIRAMTQKWAKDE